MTGRQKSKLAMLEAVEGVCSQYRHVWNQLPAFRDAFGCFQKQLRALAVLAETQRRHTGGAAQAKVSARERACLLAYEISAAIRAAAAANNVSPTDRLDFSLTQLRIGKDQLCLERCRKILAGAENKQRELDSFGITSQRIRDLAEALASFASAAEQTRDVRNANKLVTSQLPAAFRAVEQILHQQLDNLIPQFQAAAPRFYNQYQENRVMSGPSEGNFSSPVTETEEPPLLD